MKNFIKLNLFVPIFLLGTFAGIGQINPQFNPIPASYNVDSPNPVYALDINYDDIDLNQQIIHLFLPDTIGSFPLVVFTHGGGYISGTPNIALTSAARQADIKYFLENGIAYASLGYRLINNSEPDTEGVIKCLNDGKRALQFIRHHADDLHIDPVKIALQGRSAGASTSYWLGARSDMVDPNALDPVLQQSTRVCAIDIYNAQASLDLYKWETQVFNDFDGNGTNYTLDSMANLMGFDRASSFYGGFDSLYQMLYDPALIQYRADVDQLTHLSQDDPPMYINNQSGAVHPSQDLFHHAFHGREIHNTALAADIVEVKANISALSVNTTDGETGNEFLVRHLNNCSLPTAIKDIKVSENNISIYPNPVFDQFTIEGASVPYQLEILDLNGQTLQTVNIIEKSGAVDVSELPTGMYILKVKDLSTNEWKVKRIIKL